MMWVLFSYLWVLAILAAVIAPVVIGIMNRPKGRKKSAEAATESSDPLSEEQPVLDFGDELAQMESK